MIRVLRPYKIKGLFFKESSCIAWQSQTTQLVFNKSTFAYKLYLEFGETLGLIDNKCVLFYEVGLLFLLGLSSLVLLLDVLDQSERRVQVGTGCTKLTRLLDVCTPESPGRGNKFGTQ